jgi:pimeloyl-ACP methyl ester carboxylesterase
MAADREHDVTTPDGRTLRVLDVGAADGPVVVAHHGTPSARLLYRAEVDSAADRGLRLIAYDRPGYGGSTPAPDRSVVDAAADVATILDALGVARFATYGGSGGGPHALACAGVLPDRCVAAVTLAGVAPFDAPGLDWLAGMGEGNHAEFGAAREGRERLTEFCRADAAQITGVQPEDLADAMRPHLSDVDARALTGELAGHMLASVTEALRPGVEGWVDDDLAFLAPWGFDPASIRVPVLIWQGRHDLMVPADHGRWLRANVAGAEGEVLEDEGHLTLMVNRIGDVHAWLRERLAEGGAAGEALT